MPPTITSFRPDSGPVGTDVTVEIEDVEKPENVQNKVSMFIGSREAYGLLVHALGDKSLTVEGRVPEGAVPEYAAVKVIVGGKTLTAPRFFQVLGNAPEEGPRTPEFSTFSPLFASPGGSIRVRGHNLNFVNFVRLRFPGAAPAGPEGEKRTYTTARIKPTGVQEDQLQFRIPPDRGEGKWEVAVMTVDGKIVVKRGIYLEIK